MRPRPLSSATGSLLAASSLLLVGFGRCSTPTTDDSLVCSPPPSSISETPWQLVWQDEFDGPAGQSPDASRWTYDVGGSGWGNNQLEYDTDRPENVSLDGQGHLAITARKEVYVSRSYTSARILTKGLFERTYGRFEASLKTPFGQGLWPAFWLLGSRIDEVGWPSCGEVDIMENRGQEPLTILGSLHGPGYSGGGAVSTADSLPGPNGFDDAFHVFAVDWDPGRIRFEVDGVVYRTVTAADLPFGSSWVFCQPAFVILNLAVGGNFVGSPDSATVFPATLLVDYVRVYERTP